jgi:transcription antitermination factor NusG
MVPSNQETIHPISQRPPRNDNNNTVQRGKMLDMATPTRGEIVDNALARAAQDEERLTWKRLKARDELRKWYLLVIQPQHEHIVSGHLRGLGIKVFSPLIRENKAVYSRNYLRGGSYQSGTKRVPRPMFPGYLFTRIDHEAEWSKVRARSGVERIKTLDQDGRPYVVHDQIVHALYEREQQLLLGKAYEKPHDYKVGQRVRALQGPFASFVGKINRLDSKTRIRVLLDLFGRLTAVEFEAHEIEADER